MSASGLQIVIVVEVLIVFIGGKILLRNTSAGGIKVVDDAIFDEVASIGRRHGTPKGSNLPGICFLIKIA